MDIALKNYEGGFTCEGCDGRTPLFVSSSKAAKQKDKGKSMNEKLDPNKNRLYVDFKDYLEVYEKIIIEADEQCRSVPKQVIFWCKEGIKNIKK